MEENFSGFEYPEEKVAPDYYPLDIEGASEKVWQILNDHPLTRDSDKLLWLAYLQFYCGAGEKVTSWLTFKKFLLQEEVLQMATIIRCRAKIQERGYFWGTNKAKRRALAERYRAFMGASKSEADQ